ncbi:putative histidine ammonia-lyase [Mesorhizobium metallidurans STM 2683]|uniref:Putative histidine ammonia-lyase n=1 Tax=Mesorhizobium metallidurans STM 2683 TaxID=1297569 RepID=M5EN32_9HYPH|nr:histidine ammonia-lyase [Mesorhizobium metallidurans]CCV05563.1 putative histidine ammonia-lyase [Mesorhizobium metallidurans STM 2683]
MTSTPVRLTAAPLRTQDIAAIARRHSLVEVSPEADALIRASRAVIERHAAENRPVYGLTTALGAAVDTPLSGEDLIAYQRRVSFGHAVGFGSALPQEAVRAMMAVRIAGMAVGGTGISPAVFEGLVAALNAGVHPVVPSLGSLGAADLAPLAHMTLGLLGHGQAEYGGETMPAAEALERAGLKPLDIHAKDGHAIIVANSLSVAQACLALEDIEQAFQWSLRAVALNLEAFRANVSSLDDSAMAARPAFGQRAVAARLRELLSGGTLFTEGAARRIQDPLSYRCVPQVWGALRHAIDEARAATEIELASSGDNPVVLAGEDRIVSHGNFDMTAFVLSWEGLSQALAHAAAGVANRTIKLMSPTVAGLPRFLAANGQNRMGFAILQKPVSAMEAEIRFLASPISLTPIAVSDWVEDQSSMAPAVIAKVNQIIERFRYLVAMELISSAYAAEIRGVADKLGCGADEAYRTLRERVAPLVEDRELGCDVASIAAMIAQSDPQSMSNDTPCASGSALE